MFGKALKIQGSVFLKGKDRENVETALRKQFNALTIKKIFEDTDDCMQEKLVGSKMIIYHTDEYPAFVDGTGKEDYVPSLFVVAEYPQLVGTLILKKGIDEAALLKSGKVLWSQVENIEKLGEFKKDSIKKVLNSEKKLLAIIAIGCDSVDLKKELEKGVGGYILHKQGDKLWEHGPQKLGDPIEPENFDDVQEIRTQNYEEYSDDDIDLNMIAPGTKKQQAVKKENKKAPKTKPIIQQQQQVKQQQQYSDDSDNDTKQKKGGQQKQQKQPQQQQQQQQVGGVPLKVMDEYIKEAFLNACKIGVSDKQLPLEGQVFYEKFMLAFKKPGIELDFKNSTYQKIGKFLQTMQKDGLIEYKELKKGGQPQIVKIDRQNEQISDWEPTVLKAQKKQEDEKEEKQQQAVYKTSIEVQELFLPTGPLIRIFTKEVKEGEELPKLEPLTREQFIPKLNQFLKNNFKQERKFFVLTEEFTAELGIKQQESESEDEDEDVKKEKEKEKEKEQFDQNEKQKERQNKTQNLFTSEQIQKRVEELMQKSYKIKNLRLNQSEVKQGEFKGLQLIAEKQHNQQINRIVGLEYFGFDPHGKPEDIYSYAYLIKSLQETFHCGVAAHDGVGKNAGKEIYLQKNVFDQLPDYVQNILKIEAKYIHEQNKLGGSKKKQEGMTRQ